jgi:hypothetical protein
MRAGTVQVFAPMTRLGCKNAGISRANDMIQHGGLLPFYDVGALASTQ